MSYGSIDGSGFGRNPFGGPSRQGYQPLGKVFMSCSNLFLLIFWGMRFLLNEVRCGFCINIKLPSEVVLVEIFRGGTQTFIGFNLYDEDFGVMLAGLEKKFGSVSRPDCNSFISPTRSWS